jgi:hypothetical protein
VHAGDIPVLMCAMSRVVEMQACDRSGAVDWRRYFALMLDGLRARDRASPQSG